MALNSFTNFLHASALAVYTCLVYAALRAGEPHYTTSILWSFAWILILKLLGIVVHLPGVERHKPRHDFFWTLISIGLCCLNYFTLAALNLHTGVLVAGMVITFVFVGFFLYSLFFGPGYFVYIATASVLVYLLAAVFTRGTLRLAWVLIVLSSLAWILLERVPYLLRNKFHNDIYHLALIGSTYVLYATVATGLWDDNSSLRVEF